METITFKNILDRVHADTTARSAWDRGVLAYVSDIIEQLAENRQHGGMSAEQFIDSVGDAQDREMLNGAIDWRQYSEGGCSLAYDCDIAQRLCAPWELRKTRNGERNPNSQETWLQVQSRALFQAARKIKSAAIQLAQN